MKCDNKINRENDIIEIWLMSLSCALALLLCLTLLTIWVVIKYEEKSSYSKLTFRPYQFMIAYSLLTVLQATVNYAEDMAYDWTAFIAANRQILIYFAITFQLYEWMCAWMMIRFQQELDVTNVVIEKRKFMPLEL